MWEREANHGGVESVVLPQGSVCKPLSTPQSCFHKEIYKTGLQCAPLPCIMSECVSLANGAVFVVFLLHRLCKKDIHPNAGVLAGQGPASSGGAACEPPLLPRGSLGVCTGV